MKLIVYVENAEKGQEFKFDKSAELVKWLELFFNLNPFLTIRVRREF